MMSSGKEAPQFTSLNNLISEKVNAKVLFATDDWFSPCENLLKDEEPKWQEGVFTDFGKWMDGWETRRKRIPGHDWCIIQLGCPGIISGIDVNTLYFSGNYVPRVSIQAACLGKEFPARQGDRMGTAATEEEVKEAAKLQSEEWTTLVPMSKLGPGYLSSCHTFFTIDSDQRWTHLRLNLFPDGGIARMRVYGRAALDWSSIPDDKLMDLVAMVNGGVSLGSSNSHYGHARNLIGLGRAGNMGDGWETARRLDRPAILVADDNNILQVPGYEWSLFKLGHSGIIDNIEIDTNHFKGNFPDSCRIEACFITEGDDESVLKDFNNPAWKQLLPAQKLKGHTRHYYSAEVRRIGVVSHVRLVMAPDGGISRMRLWGYKSGRVPSPKI